MKYKIVTVESEFGVSNHVVLELDNGFEAFPVDENNPRYQQWLIEIGEQDGN